MAPVGRTALLALLLLCLTVAPAHAQVSQTFTVNTTSDGTDFSPGDGSCSAGDGTPVCTLRAAIQEANSTAATADTIVVPASTYHLTRFGVDDNAFNGDLDINSPITITGAGARTTVVDQDVADRVFDVVTTSGLVLIQGITITGGNLNGGGNGAGLHNAGPNTQLVDSAVRSNVAGTASAGGGLANDASGNLTVDRTLIADNQ